MSWVFFAVTSGIGFGLITLFLTHFSRITLPTTLVQAYFWSLTALGFIFLSLLNKNDGLKVSASQLSLFILLAFVAVVTNYLSLRALGSGPNPGVIKSIQLISLIVVSIGGVLLFSQSLNARVLLGMLLIVIGAIIVANN